MSTMKLGRLGVWYSADKHAGVAELAAFVKNVEKLGYDTLWYPESRGYESFTVAGYMLSQTRSLKIGSSMLGMPLRLGGG
jgi:alkanesulfonate monooxygenase SsuD/methylene tetrahydromethanopterin reductase-like flavin-dependent oxidoreductase (luciferase family)